MMNLPDLQFLCPSWLMLTADSFYTNDFRARRKLDSLLGLWQLYLIGLLMALWTADLYGQTAVIPPIIFEPTYRGGDSIPSDFRAFHYWDETDTLVGHVQHLGQVGKAYQHYRYGLLMNGIGASIERRLFNNPLTGTTNAYLWNPSTQVQSYDTYSPYVDVSFWQSRRQAQLFGVRFGQNLTPFWNISAQYHRRSVVGAYLNNLTDTYNMAIANHFHTFNGRYQVQVNLTFQQHNNNYHGGTFNKLIDGADSIRFEDSFEKVGQLLFFNQSPAPRMNQRVRSFYVAQSFRLMRLSSFELVPFLTFTRWDYSRTYSDLSGYDRAAMLEFTSNPYRPYPGLRAPFADTSNWQLRFSESGILNLTQLSGGAYATWLREAYAIKARYGVQVDWTAAQPGQALWMDTQVKQTQFWEANLEIRGPGLFLHHRFDVSTNNLFAAEALNELTLTWKPLQNSYSLVDTVYQIPRGLKRINQPVYFSGIDERWRLSVSLLTQSRNPSLFQSYWQGNTFEGNPNFRNEILQHMRGLVRYQAKFKSAKGLAFDPNYLEFVPYFSWVQRPIYYTSEAAVRQGSSNSSYSWIGIEMAGRYRLGRFYVEGRVTAQQGNSSGDSLAPYARNLPTLYGRTNLYFRQRIPISEVVLYLGLEGYWQNAHEGFAFEPATQVFFPRTAYQIPGYARVDLVLTARIRRNTQIFVKFIHANEGIFAPGYYTVPLYPMLERSFSFGVNWRFFD